MERPNWNELLSNALTQPGRLSEAYSVFYDYSLGNALLAARQLHQRNLPISPIATYKKWQELGRNVKKGEKALALIMPITIKDDDEGSRTFFVLKNNWFALNQTEGGEYKQKPVASAWNKASALSELGINEREFLCASGNTQGYAMPNEKTFAVNPLAALPWKTTFHELAHCLLHSADALLSDNAELSKCVKEIEAECVAYLCCATLNLPGLEESRGYIQAWLKNGDVDLGKSAQRIFNAANKILKAGNNYQ